MNAPDAPAAAPRVLQGRKVVGGVAEGLALVTRQPVSFFGGVDPVTGVVVEKGHDLEHQCLQGRVLVYPTGKGSTGGSYRLYEMARRGCGPAAIVVVRAESIATIGAVMGAIPMVHQCNADPTSVIATGDRVRVEGDAGRVIVMRP